MHWLPFAHAYLLCPSPLYKCPCLTIQLIIGLKLFSPTPFALQFFLYSLDNIFSRSEHKILKVLDGRTEGVPSNCQWNVSQSTLQWTKLFFLIISTVIFVITWVLCSLEPALLAVVLKRLDSEISLNQEKLCN